MEHSVLPDDKAHELHHHAEHLRSNAARIINLRTVMELDITEKGAASIYLHGADDIVTKDFHLPVHKQVNLLIRSQDVIHSVFIPHLRAQMNAVPGMTTVIAMVPTITTDSMRTHVMHDETFDFIVMCNKICGASHYNMQMPLIVTEAGDYDTWMTEQMTKPFQASAVPPATPGAVPMDTVAVSANEQAAVQPTEPN